MVKITTETLVLLAENSALLVILAISKLPGKRLSWPHFNVRLPKPVKRKSIIHPRAASPLLKKTIRYGQKGGEVPLLEEDEKNDNAKYINKIAKKNEKQ